MSGKGLRIFQKGVREKYPNDPVFREEEKVKKHLDHNREIQKAMDDYVIASRSLSKIEKRMGRLINERRSLEIRPQHVVNLGSGSSDSLSLFPEMQPFLDRVGQVVSDVGRHREDLHSRVHKTMTEPVRESHVYEQGVKQWMLKYQKVEIAYMSQYKKFQQFLDDALKTERESRSEVDFKKKMKKEKLEGKKWETCLKKLEELEPLKKLAIVTHQKVHDSLEHFQAHRKNELEYALCGVVNEFKHFYKREYERFRRIEEDFDVKKKLGSYHRLEKGLERFVVKKVRPEYRIMSQVQLIGVPLEELMSREEEVGDIPYALDMLLQYIEKRADSVGLFRQPGNNRLIKLFVRHLQMGRFTEIFSRINDVHTMASALKEYVKRLPVAPMPFEYFMEFTKISDDAVEKRIDYLKTQLKKMPKEHQCVTYRMFQLYDIVSQHSEKNKMTPKNLALCMALNTIRDSEKVVNTGMGKTTNSMNVKSFPVFKFMLDHYQELYGEDSKDNCIPSKNSYEKSCPQIRVEEILTTMQKVMKKRVDLVELLDMEPEEGGSLKKMKKKEKKSRPLSKHSSWGTVRIDVECQVSEKDIEESKKEKEKEKEEESQNDGEESDGEEESEGETQSGSDDGEDEEESEGESDEEEEGDAEENKEKGETAEENKEKEKDDDDDENLGEGEPTEEKVEEKEEEEVEEKKEEKKVPPKRTFSKKPKKGKHKKHSSNILGLLKSVKKKVGKKKSKHSSMELPAGLPKAPKKPLPEPSEKKDAEN